MPDAVDDADALACFTSVHSNADLWVLVLGRVPLHCLPRCTATCTAHRQILQRCTQHITHLGVCLLPGPEASLSFRGTTVPRVCFLPAMHDSAFLVGANVHINDALSVTRDASRAQSILPRLTGLLPRCRVLRVDLSPIPHEVRGSPTATGPRAGNGIDRLDMVASWLAERRPPAKRGPEPWIVMQTRLTHLAITCEALSDEPSDDSGGGFIPYIDRRRTREARDSVTSIFMMCAVGCQQTLTHLDLTGLGPIVLPALVCLDLPVLQLLRLGSERPSGAWADAHSEPWHKNTLSLLGVCFPTLTGLDIGYANVRGGVSFEEVETLATCCEGLRHLDLSMVMTYRDFSPSLVSLSKQAPNLTSLAIHGLNLQTHALETFARGCAQLARVHFVHCGYSATGLAAFLRGAKRLRDIDLSLGCCFDDEEIDYEALLDRWVVDRAADESSSASPRVAVLTYEDEERNGTIHYEDHPDHDFFTCYVPAWLRERSVQELREEGKPIEELFGARDLTDEARTQRDNRYLPWRSNTDFMRHGWVRLFHNLGQPHLDDGNECNGKRSVRPFDRDFPAGTLTRGKGWWWDADLSVDWD